ncbi:DUF4352 domain-containing protein (plasmid) [Rossellomorea marisflavi]|uniref:DUF4352 domain-containing protein n=1 Tax=Rossellomorea marisflavi TaxID=189381 RepID=UPI00131965DA|nr:DUF4352 domain-containing protein [Rossellomorea marisflavi]QHA38740.1 DUF4352 domain-containing protein [Rossellomorea marisflavi]
MREKRSDIFGFLSLGVGFIGLLNCLVPIVGLITIVFSIIFGIISLIKKERTKWKAITGISISFTALIIATVAIIISFIPDPTLSQVDKPDWAPEEVYDYGYPVKHDDVEISVNKVFFSDGKMIRPGITIKNIGEDTVHYSPTDFTLVQDQGNEKGKRINPVTNSELMLKSGELEPGEEISGEIEFVFPVNHSFLALVYKDEVYIDVTID